MKLIIARDSYGIRPVFYFINEINQALGVCSEVKGMFIWHNLATTTLKSKEMNVIQL